MLRSAIDGRLEGIHTSLPGRIESYDYKTQKASVKPLVKRVYRDGRTESLPVIDAVPVVFPRSGGASLTFPVKRGDGVLLVFAERALENWLTSGGEQEPGDPRRFDLTDAIAVPGLIPFTEGSKAQNNSDVLLTYNGASLKIDDNKKFAMGNDKAELLDLFDQLLEALIASLCYHGSPLTQQPAMIEIKAKLQEIKGQL